MSGVSPKSELSVTAGLDSAGEASENVSVSKGFLGVVKAGLRNGGAMAVRLIWEVENIERCEGVPGVFFESDGADCIWARGLLRPSAPPKVLVLARESGSNDTTP